jgi:hypothetical protein
MPSELQEKGINISYLFDTVLLQITGHHVCISQPLAEGT